MNIALVGYGKMGQVVHSRIHSDDKIVGIVSEGYLASLKDIEEKVDVVIDFSHPSNLMMILDYCLEKHACAVIATTGYTASQIEQIEKYSNKVAILYTANFSLGVTLMNKVIKEITPILKDSFDIEVVEAHHNKKIDAPSGTAQLFLKSINQENEFEVVNGRNGISKRTTKEIGVHSIRGGSIVGEHRVIYAGDDEILEVRHEALSKNIFANGAVKGAKWLFQKPAGLYSMEDVLF